MQAAADRKGNIQTIIDEQGYTVLFQVLSANVIYIAEQSGPHTLSVIAFAFFAMVRKSRVEAVFSRICTIVTPPVGKGRKLRFQTSWSIVSDCHTLAGLVEALEEVDANRDRTGHIV